MYTFRTMTTAAAYRPLMLDPAAPFQQAWFYGDWKKQAGAHVVRAALTDAHGPLAYLQLISCPLPRGHRYYVCPYGPVLAPRAHTRGALRALRDGVRMLLRQYGGAFARLDFTPPLQPVQQRLFHRAPAVTMHGACLQPRREWVVPIAATDAALLRNMHHKTRYNIRLAARRGVTVRIVTRTCAAVLPDFLAVQAATARRQGFTPPADDYFAAIVADLDRVNATAAVPRGFFAVASYNDTPLTINLVLLHGATAMFAFGGSAPVHRNRMANYLAHWEAMRFARTVGCLYYNFGGYYDADGPPLRAATRERRMGFSTFKRRFGGRVIEHGPLCDVVAQPLVYHAYIGYKMLRHA